MNKNSFKQTDESRLSSQLATYLKLEQTAVTQLMISVHSNCMSGIKTIQRFNIPVINSSF